MPRLFGTDGIRGVANSELRPTLAYGLGRATAARLLAAGESLLVGQDTRRSGDMFVAAITAGASSMGIDVHRLGVCPTPGLAYVTASGPYGAGIMVSASHNPADDNGLKVLDDNGFKLDEPIEDELEALIWGADELVGPGNAGIGREVDARSRLSDYEAHRIALAATISTDVRLVLDCAHGSGGVIGPRVLAATGASVDVRFNEPDGHNINLDCGATAPAAAAQAVRDGGADVGFALDGDQLIGIIALDRLARGALPGGMCVVSVLSNGGLEAAIRSAGGRVARTPVGDKYILEGMLVAGAGLGGEKSGHVIVREHTTSGDGIVTALELLGIVSRSGRPLSELAAQISLYPQQQRTVRVRHKEQWEADPTFADAVAEAQRMLNGRGRVLVRPSGTEPALRIMVEGEGEEQVASLADELAELAAQRLN